MRCCCRCRPATRTAWPTCARRRTTWWRRSAASAPRAMPPARRTLLEVGISTAFGCTIQGRVAEDEVRAPGAGRARRRRGQRRAWPTPWATPIRRWCRALFEKVLRVAGDKPDDGALPRHARPGPGQLLTPRCSWASRASTPASAASAAARTRPAPAATWPPKTWPTCWPAWASRPAWTSTRCWRCAASWPAGSKARPCTARSGAPACRRPMTPARRLAA